MTGLFLKLPYRMTLIYYDSFRQMDKTKFSWITRVNNSDLHYRTTQYEQKEGFQDTTPHTYFTMIHIFIVIHVKQTWGFSPWSEVKSTCTEDYLTSCTEYWQVLEAQQCYTRYILDPRVSYTYALFRGENCCTNVILWHLWPSFRLSYNLLEVMIHYVIHQKREQILACTTSGKFWPSISYFVVESEIWSLFSTHHETKSSSSANLTGNCRQYYQLMSHSDLHLWPSSVTFKYQPHDLYEVFPSWYCSGWLGFEHHPK